MMSDINLTNIRYTHKRGAECVHLFDYRCFYTAIGLTVEQRCLKTA